MHRPILYIDWHKCQSCRLCCILKNSRTGASTVNDVSPHTPLISRPGSCFPSQRCDFDGGLWGFKNVQILQITLFYILFFLDFFIETFWLVLPLHLKLFDMRSWMLCSYLIWEKLSINLDFFLKKEAKDYSPFISIETFFEFYSIYFSGVAFTFFKKAENMDPIWKLFTWSAFWAFRP